MNKRIFILSMVSIATSVVTIRILSQTAEQPLLQQPCETSQSVVLAPHEIATLTHQQTLASNEQRLTAMQQLPASLRGLPTPQQLDINADGTLIINEKVLSMFEFYFSGLGEETLAIVAHRINDFMIKTLVSPALERAQDIFKNYLTYLNQLTLLKSEYEQASSSLSTLSLAKAEIVAIRQQHFSDEVIDVFWGKHTQYEQFMLAMAVIKNDKSTTQSEKDLAIQNVKQLTPQWLITQQEQANQLNHYRAEYQLLDEHNADSTALNDLAENQFGAEAATRLADLRRERQQWQQRIAQYRIELDQLMSLDLTALILHEQLIHLRQSHFNEQERKRITALDNNYKLNNAAQNTLR